MALSNNFNVLIYFFKDNFLLLSLVYEIKTLMSDKYFIFYIIHWKILFNLIKLTIYNLKK